MRVREIMTGQVATVGVGDTVAYAEDLMGSERIRHLPVVDGDVLVGIVSQRDVLAASLPSTTHPDEEEDRALKRKILVRNVMRGFVETVGPDTDLAEVADKILSYKIGCLPIVDERLHVLGIVTEADFVRLARDLLRRVEADPASHPRRARARRA